ncbi:hypothetical protein P153DRAFT_419228 [Dothidotthia symphoricarpi CBS 119687]|uniref:Exonuclease V n=1 Tax=Dothidotthia symphoricarpi CBS 119687 TaxID=1392245 RepID=A0A6A6ARJ7_9PLEO|nr:uncharacterized protein P153DRAFT_419228 [Dothidotthia symphoricarpi CBS 119687]KAF2134549.1 hypothetical protein P153DRAFT_419228 [Dothidotthia symphoricarpi CBS 119687]
MATTTAQGTISTSNYGSDIDLHSTSDYGSDVDLEDIDNTILAVSLGTIQEGRHTEKSVVLPSVEFEEGEREDEEQDVDGFVQIHKPAVLRVAKGKQRSSGVVDTQRDFQSSPMRERALEVEYDERSRRAWSVPLEEPPSPSARAPRSRSKSKTPRASRKLSIPEVVDAAQNDARPPLERFRTKPKKCLSVTDLISPAWCELQYFYTLSTFGRKPRTQAMKTGSKIHKTLEDQVHTTVPVQVASNEDKFGLRIWNAISGLRCLRETGLTRELEVWGVLEGQVVNGVIDELSYNCPDPAFEAQLEKSRAEKSGGTVPLPPGQLSISQAFANASQPNSTEEQMDDSPTDRQIYIADVKTRSAPSLPTGASLRPTWMQLMLYRKLLYSLSLNTVDAETIFARYDLRPLESFTPTFIDSIADIGPTTEATSFPNLLSLWSLLITEIQTTLPPFSLSPILRAEFRFAKTGDVLGSELTVYEDEIIDGYVGEEMAFWKGTREPKGVEIEDAFKCRICDFAESCGWRQAKVEEATEKSRLRRSLKERSAV